MIDVVAAVIHRDDTFLVARRRGGALHGKWEFPGGKVETGENYREALEREIFEEFSVRIRVKDYVGTADFNIDYNPARLHAYFAEYISGDFNPAEHQAVRWVSAEQLRGMDLAPADVPIADQVVELVGLA